MNSIALAHGVSCGGRMKLLPGMEPAAEFSVLVHELGHEMLHRGERQVETSKTIRETEAEAAAFVVSNSTGLDTKTASADYIALYVAGIYETQLLRATGALSRG